MSFSPYSPENTLKTFITFRVMGDSLNPDEITQILKVVPSVAYRKGEPYSAGARTGTLSGKTGVWMISTERKPDRGIDSKDFADHLNAILAVFALDQLAALIEEHAKFRFPTLADLMPGIVPVPTPLLRGRLAQLQPALQQRGLSATLACYWYGVPGATPPSIPEWLLAVFRQIPISVEQNFDTEAAALTA